LLVRRDPHLTHEASPARPARAVVAPRQVPAHPAVQADGAETFVHVLLARRTRPAAVAVAVVGAVRVDADTRASTWY